MGLKEILHRYKPGVSIRTHLLLGGLIWTVVGFFSSDQRLRPGFSGKSFLVRIDRSIAWKCQNIPHT
jgi:hypothetical protein